jgi:hypothetical protein
MKLDVFESVSTHEAEAAGGMPEPVYRFELLPQYSLDKLEDQPAREFIARIFDDLLVSVEDDANYESKYTFDKNVFQKFIAVMFVNYATTEPMFYGTNKADYGVSADKEMQDTPLYRAIAVALRDLEREHPMESRPTPAPRAPAPAEPAPPVDAAVTPAAAAPPAAADSPVFQQPLWAHAEQTLMEPFFSLAEALQLLRRLDHPRARECGEIIRLNVRRIFRQLKTLGLISPVVADPLDHLDDLHHDSD